MLPDCNVRRLLGFLTTMGRRRADTAIEVGNAAQGLAQGVVG